MEPIIRLAKQDELKEIQDLNYQLFLHDEEFDPLLNMNWPYEDDGTKYFQNRISGVEGVCFVAEVGGKVVGYLAGAIAIPYQYRTIKKLSELENTLVLEEYRGQGIGEELFNSFIQWSKEHDAQLIKVSAAANNTRAIKFYRRVGFKDYGLELEYYIS